MAAVGRHHIASREARRATIVAAVATVRPPVAVECHVVAACREAVADVDADKCTRDAPNGNNIG